jgi:Kelch motif
VTILRTQSPIPRLLSLSGLSVICAVLLGACNLLPPSVTDLQLSDQESQRILEIQDAAGDMYKRLVEEGDSQAGTEVVEWLKGEALVLDAQVTSSGNISIKYSCGLGAGIVGDYSNASASIDPLSENAPGQGAPDRTLGRVQVDNAKSSKGATKALILLPFEWDFGTPAGIPGLIEELEGAGFEVEGPVVNEAVTVEILQTLQEYEFIYIETHGIGHGALLGHQTAIATGTRADFLSLQWLYALGVGIELVTVPEGGTYLGVNARLLDNFSYPESVVIVSACESFKNDTLANAFLLNGASAFLGWTEKTPPLFSDIATFILAGLIAQPAATVMDAYTTPVRVDMDPVHGEYSVDQIFPYPWTLTSGPFPREYSPDFRLAGAGNFVLNSPDLAWEERSPMPTPRGFTSAVVYDDLIYVIGGCSSDTPEQFDNEVATLEAYQPALDAWVALAPMSTPRVGPAAAVLDDKIYVVGGFSRSTWSANSSMEIYDINSGQWSIGPPKPTPCSWASAAVVDGKIYVFGGAGYEYYDKCEAYDPETNTWSSCTAFAGGRYLHATAQVGRRIYLIGGDRWDPRFIYDDLQIYDPAADSWSLGEPMPTAESLLKACVFEGRIWVFGSESLCRTYEIGEGSWRDLSSSHDRSGGFSIAAVDGVAYRFGGGEWGPTLDIVEAAVLLP